MVPNAPIPCSPMPKFQPKTLPCADLRMLPNPPPDVGGSVLRRIRPSSCPPDRLISFHLNVEYYLRLLPSPFDVSLTLECFSSMVLPDSCSPKSPCPPSFAWPSSSLLTGSAVLFLHLHTTVGNGDFHYPPFIFLFVSTPPG